MASMKELYNVSVAPHIRSDITTGTIMRDVVIALIPASAFGIVHFGYRALLVILASITTCVLSEFAYMRLMKRKQAAYECSAIVTGLLLALNLPPTVPVWIPIIGGVFAIIVVKQIFGGLGQNFMNPALMARCFLVICYAKRMTDFDILPYISNSDANKALHYLQYGTSSIDGITGATPLQLIKTTSVSELLSSGRLSISDMFLGLTGGTIGETSSIMLLLGGAYLVYRKVITLHIPLAYVGTLAVFVMIFGGQGMNPYYLAAHIFGGGLLIGAIFMATDYVTSPITKNGRILFGICLGILTGLYRIYGGNAGGVSFAIIFGNLLVPLIEKATMPVAFGMHGNVGIFRVFGHVKAVFAKKRP